MSARRAATGLAVAAAIAACAPAAPRPPATAEARDPTSAPRIVWEETFERMPAWVAPRGHGDDAVRAVFSVARDGGRSFLLAVHDARAPSAVGAVHFGKRFDPPVPLADVVSLSFAWRVEEHPAPTSDPWRDLGASVYVVFRPPSLLSRGRGLKLGWLAKDDGAPSTQLGLAQIPLRVAPASAAWIEEAVDPCALHRARGGRCEDEELVYVGVVTDADDTRSRARAGYAGFKLLARR